MKKLLLSIAALSLIAPSVASAQPAAQALSLKAAAVQPVRASAKQGEAKALPTAVIVVVGIAAAVGIYFAVKGSDSN